jgi:hypothetical protein
MLSRCMGSLDSCIQPQQKRVVRLFESLDFFADRTVPHDKLIPIFPPIIFTDSTVVSSYICRAKQNVSQKTQIAV